jgi:hypothetical protein
VTGTFTLNAAGRYTITFGFSSQTSTNANAIFRVLDTAAAATVGVLTSLNSAQVMVSITMLYVPTVFPCTIEVRNASTAAVTLNAGIKGSVNGTAAFITIQLTE